jgi:DNA-binding XRE family transcriptional regulator
MDTPKVAGDALFENLERIEQAQRQRIRRRRRSHDPLLQAALVELILARHRAGFTQEQLAYWMGTKKSAISRLERGGGCRPTWTTIERYALTLGYEVRVTLRRRAGHPANVAIDQCSELNGGNFI